MRATAILAVLPFVAVASASVNGHCTGAHATGDWGEYGICVSIGDCDHYGGKHTDNACPYDGDGIKCCVVGMGPDIMHDPCGGTSRCQWMNSNGKCDSGWSNVRNDCPGGDNYSCCKLN